MLVEAAEGILIYQHGVDPLAARWWNSLGEDERGQAQTEARRYQGLSEEERYCIWGEGAESIGEDAEGDEEPPRLVASCALRLAYSQRRSQLNSLHNSSRGNSFYT